MASTLNNLYFFASEPSTPRPFDAPAPAGFVRETARVVDRYAEQLCTVTDTYIEQRGLERVAGLRGHEGSGSRQVQPPFHCQFTANAFHRGSAAGGPGCARGRERAVPADLAGVVA